MLMQDGVTVKVCRACPPCSCPAQRGSTLSIRPAPVCTRLRNGRLPTSGWARTGRSTPVPRRSTLAPSRTWRGPVVRVVPGCDVVLNACRSQAPEVFTPVQSSEAAPYEGGPVDVWSLGVMLYVMITCKYPFGGLTGDEGVRFREIDSIRRAILNAEQELNRPDFFPAGAVSEELRHLIRSMLQVPPTPPHASMDC
jgi:serine/threonine protein kinase